MGKVYFIMLEKNENIIFTFMIVPEKIMKIYLKIINIMKLIIIIKIIIL
jgi:hypothetical protein